MRNGRWITCSLLVTAGVVVACESGGGGGLAGAVSALKDKLVGGAVKKVAEEAEKYAKNQLDAVVPSTQAGVVALPAKATGGLDTTASITGKTGTASQDMDGDGEAETVDVLVSDSGQTYVTWQKEGVCFMSWVADGTEYVQFASCDDKTGAFVCHSTGADTFACQGCSADGTCADCTNNDLTTCSWSGATDGTADGSSDGAESADAGDSGDGADASDAADGADMTDASDGADMTDASDGADMTDMTDASDGADMTDMTDASDGSGPGPTCNEVMQCAGQCADEECVAACAAPASDEVYGAFSELFMCYLTNCSEEPVEACAPCTQEYQTCEAN